MNKEFTLVLGGTGFLGSWIVHELTRRALPTLVLSRHQHQGEPPAHGTVYLQGDCGDPDLLNTTMRKCKAVIHAAGYYPLFSLERGHQAERGLQELRNVLRAVRAADVERFVFTSSPMVLIKDPDVFRSCTYHYIKKLLHDEVLRWVDAGLPAVLAIPGACFGPGDRKPTTGRLILEIARGHMRFVVEGKMNAVDARDVARAEVEMLLHGQIGEAYQLGNWNCMFSDFAALVARLSDVPAPRVTIPYEVARSISRTMERFQFLFGASRPLFPECGVDQVHHGTHVDSSLAVRDLNFRVRPITETVLSTLQYFLQTGMLKPRHSIAKPSSSLYPVTATSN